MGSSNDYESPKDSYAPRGRSWAEPDEVDYEASKSSPRHSSSSKSDDYESSKTTTRTRSSEKSEDYESSKTSPRPISSGKSDDYESSKYTPEPEKPKVRRSSKTYLNMAPISNKKLNELREGLNRLLEIYKEIEIAKQTLQELQKEKAKLEAEISQNPEYDEFAKLLISIKGRGSR